MSNDQISYWAYPGIVILGKKVTFEIIRDAVCCEFNLPFSEIASSSQKRTYLEPRQILQTLTEILTDETQTRIAMRFQGRNGKCRDHASVIHSKMKFYEHYKMEIKYQNIVRKILLKIGITSDYFDK